MSDKDGVETEQSDSTVAQLPLECDHCGQFLDEDEELIPIWIGEPLDPINHIEQATVEKSELAAMGRGQIPKVLGKGPSEWAALLRVLDKSDRVTYSMAPRVYEPDPAFVGVGEEPELGDPTPFGENVTDDKAGAELRIDISPDMPAPDLRVCEYCEQSLRGEGNGK